MRLHARQPSRRRRHCGQALAEFALVIPIFLVLVVAIAEFGLLVTIRNGVTLASQDATSLASQLGNSQDADVYVLRQIEQDLQPPVDKSKIVSVSIFWTDLNGSSKGTNTYVRGGSMTNTDHTITVPYSQTANGYPVADRCNVISAEGCAAGHDGVDWVGVTITYQYDWATPLPTLIGMGSSPPTFVETNASRLEPIR